MEVIEDTNEESSDTDKSGSPETTNLPAKNRMYVSVGGKRKIFRYMKCSCSKQCHKLSRAEREAAFKNFCELGATLDERAQRKYICEVTMTNLTKTGLRISYYLPNRDGKLQAVCVPVFTKTLQITAPYVRRIASHFFKYNEIPIKFRFKEETLVRMMEEREKKFITNEESKQKNCDSLDDMKFVEVTTSKRGTVRRINLPTTGNDYHKLGLVGESSIKKKFRFFECRCLKGCNQLTKREKEAAFEAYYELGAKFGERAQRKYVCEVIETTPIRNDFRTKYFLPNRNGILKPVCLRVFEHTLQITFRYLRKIIGHYLKYNEIPVKFRFTRKEPTVKEINQAKSYASTYQKQHFELISQMKWLDIEEFKTIYHDYNAWCNKNGTKAVPEVTYRPMFLSLFRKQYKIDLAEIMGEHDEPNNTASDNDDECELSNKEKVSIADDTDEGSENSSVSNCEENKDNNEEVGDQIQENHDVNTDTSDSDVSDSDEERTKITIIDKTALETFSKWKNLDKFIKVPVAKPTLKYVKCRCSENCCKTYPRQYREMVFDLFDKLETQLGRNAQRKYVLQLLKVTQHGPIDRRKDIFEYRLPDSTGRLHKVCATAFVSSLQISGAQVTRIKYYYLRYKKLMVDNRCTAKKYRPSAAQVKQANQHAEEFLTDPENFFKDETGFYVDPSITIRDIYDTYRDWCFEREYEPIRMNDYEYTFANLYDVPNLPTPIIDD